VLQSVLGAPSRPTFPWCLSCQHQRLLNLPTFCCLPCYDSGCREESREMFRFAYGQYMQRAFPRDDLRPISCRGKDSQGGIALTLIDSLDTLVVRCR